MLFRAESSTSSANSSFGFGSSFGSSIFDEESEAPASSDIDDISSELDSKPWQTMENKGEQCARSNKENNPPPSAFRLMMDPARNQAYMSSHAPLASLDPKIDPLILSTIVEVEGGAMLDLPVQESASRPSQESLIDARHVSIKSEPRELVVHRTSYVWKHMEHPDPNHIYYNDEGFVVWRCQCGHQYKASGGTAIIHAHLWDKHGIKKGSLRVDRVKRVHQSIKEAMERAAASTHKRRKLAADGEIEKRRIMEIDPYVLEQLFVKWFASGCVPFRMVENLEFRAILTYLNSGTDQWLPNSADSVSPWVFRTYEQQKIRIKNELLKKAQSKIHLTSDCWSSPNDIPIIAIIGHFMAHDKLQRVVLSIKEIQGKHTGENLSSYVYQALVDWDIVGDLGFMVMDNAANMDKLTEELSLSITPFSLYLLLFNRLYKSRLIMILPGLWNNDNIHWRPELHRIRCSGHIINLISNAFLYQTADDALHEENNKGVNLDLLNEGDLRRWRKYGPIGKVHNTAKIIASSPQRMQSFTALSRGTKIPRDNVTRWLSLYKTICCISQPGIRAALETFRLRNPDVISESDVLHPHDFAQLDKIKLLLQALEDTIKYNQSHDATLDRVLPTMDFILEHFEKGKELYKDDPFLSPSCNSAWIKADKYYTLTDRSVAYVAAVALDPMQKMTYFEVAWAERPEWITKAYEDIQEFWEHEYKLRNGRDFHLHISPIGTTIP